MAISALFADILDYPSRPIGGILQSCAAELAVESSEASAHMIAFQEAIASKSLGQLQEIYTNAFDLRPDCTPNLGYHLFGDDGRRGLFLAELKGRMTSSGIALGWELPDHISLLLRYMQHNERECRDLVEDCMLPAVSRMAQVLEPSDNPYKHVLRAFVSLLQHQCEGASEAAGAIKA